MRELFTYYQFLLGKNALWPPQALQVCWTSQTMTYMPNIGIQKTGRYEISDKRL